MNASCQCGAIRFQTPLPSPLAVYICHCTSCRAQSASAFGCSATFPPFPLPQSLEPTQSQGSIIPSLTGEQSPVGCWTRTTDSGNTIDCYFCKKCGTRLAHANRGRDMVSVKGGCLEGLKWEEVNKHIWCRSAVVPIPEGAEKWEKEPDA